MSIAGKHFAVIGAGIVGSALALWLNNQGGRVSIYERRNAKAFLTKTHHSKKKHQPCLKPPWAKMSKPPWTERQMMPLCCPMYGRKIYPWLMGHRFSNPMGFPTKPFILFPDLT